MPIQSKMTAETLKPYMSLPGNYSPERRSSHRLITIGLGASFLIVSIVLLGFTIWNSIRVCELQREVNSLQNTVGRMQKSLNLHYIEDLDEVENGYDNFLVDDPKPYSKSDEDIDDDEDEDDVDDDDDDDDDEGDEHLYDAIKSMIDLVGSGHYDDLDFYRDDDADDEDDDDDEDDEGDIFATNSDKEFDGFGDASDWADADKKRKTRSIASSSQGVPIFQDSYALKRNRTGGPEDHRIEQHLLAKKSATPTLRYDWSEKSTKRPSPSGGDDGQRGRYKSAPNNMLRSLNQNGQRNQRRHNKQTMLRPLLKSGKESTGKMQAIPAHAFGQMYAVHYHLNSTMPEKPNNRMDQSKPQPDGDIYIGHPHEWVTTFGTDRPFSVSNGILTVLEPGLYMVYAQVCYDNRFDRNGFVVYHNMHPFLQCLLYVPSNAIKRHTCFTNGLIYMAANDELHIRDIHQDRTVMLAHAKSFFGVIKLSH